VAGFRSAWQTPPVRRASVADEFRTAQRIKVASLTPGERVLLALSLGRRSLDAICASRRLSSEQARVDRERRLQSRRRPSACLEALLS
jgi:hypothetical protein